MSRAALAKDPASTVRTKATKPAVLSIIVVIQDIHSRKN
jgi:hypothetical protein